MLSIKHRAAFQLVSIRTGRGAQQPYHLAGQTAVDFSLDGVRREAHQLLEKLNGKEGKEVRKNAETLGAAMERAWQEGGEAITQTESFLKTYIDA
jgi:hypothetical protein